MTCEKPTGENSREKKHTQSATVVHMLHTIFYYFVIWFAFYFDLTILCGASADNETIRDRSAVARHTHQQRRVSTHTAVVAVAAAVHTKIVVFFLDKMNVQNRAAR